MKNLPPLVLFGRYGSNSHSAGSGDDNHHFLVADRAERRARRVNAQPSLLGYSTRSGGSADKKEQERKWIKICLDRPKSQPPSN